MGLHPARPLSLSQDSDEVIAPRTSYKVWSLVHPSSHLPYDLQMCYVGHIARQYTRARLETQCAA